MMISSEDSSTVDHEQLKCESDSKSRRTCTYQLWRGDIQTLTPELISTKPECPSHPKPYSLKWSKLSRLICIILHTAFLWYENATADDYDDVCLWLLFLQRFVITHNRSQQISRQGLGWWVTWTADPWIRKVQFGALLGRTGEGRCRWSHVFVGRAVVGRDVFGGCLGNLWIFCWKGWRWSCCWSRNVSERKRNKHFIDMRLGKKICCWCSCMTDCAVGVGFEKKNTFFVLTTTAF